LRENGLVLLVISALNAGEPVRPPHLSSNRKPRGQACPGVSLPADREGGEQIESASILVMANKLAFIPQSLQKPIYIEQPACHQLAKGLLQEITS